LLSATYGPIQNTEKRKTDAPKWRRLNNPLQKLDNICRILADPNAKSVPKKSR